MIAEQLRYLLAAPRLDGFTVNETIIAQAWIKKHAAEYDTVELQFRIGTQQDPGPNYDATLRAQAMLQSQKRTDMIARRGRKVCIVEVKIRVSLDALGQLLGYHTLWCAEHPGEHDVHTVAIGQTALLDAAEIFHAHGVALETFPEVVLQLKPTA